MKYITLALAFVLLGAAVVFAAPPAKAKKKSTWHASRTLVKMPYKAVKGMVRHL